LGWDTGSRGFKPVTNDLRTAPPHVRRTVSKGGLLYCERKKEWRSVFTFHPANIMPCPLFCVIQFYENSVNVFRGDKVMKLLTAEVFFYISQSCSLLLGPNTSLSNLFSNYLHILSLGILYCSILLH
jgi:hypothetical protein